MRFVLAALLLATSSTFATTLDFTTTGELPASAPGTPVSDPLAAFTISFSLLDTPVPVDSFPGVGFVVQAPVTYQFGATTLNIGPTDINFASSGSGGGFFFTLISGADAISFSFAGPQLYTGTEGAPVFAPGLFALPPDDFSYIAINDGDPLLLGTSALSIAEESIPESTVPEPGSISLAVAGLALVGWKSRRALRV